MTIATEPICPSRVTLDDLLANRLASSRAEQVRRHVSACALCKSRLGQPEDGDRPFAFLEPPGGPDEVARLGAYRILGVLGVGGMAIVFEAEDDRLHRRVALKVLRPEQTTPVMRERFLREARLLASLPHEHIVAVYEVGEANGVPFMAMERLEGTTLEDRLKQDHTLPLDEALSIARQAAEGLQEAHEKDLVHRDVKPPNIWLETCREGRFRRVKLLDFGIARRTTDGASLTVSGQIVGTPAYMAPEQAMGLPVDHRADIYSLGCVLYRMLIGVPPFEGGAGETMALLAAVIKGDAPPVDAAAPHLPPAVARLIQRMIARAPGERPRSARELVAELRRLEAEPLAAGPAPTLPLPAHTPSRRTRVFGIALGGGIILAALVVGALAVWNAMTGPRDANGGNGGPALKGDPIKVGVLHSKNGPMSFHEKHMLHATQLALEEVSKAGVLGRPVEYLTLIRDGNSDEATFAKEARDLIEKEGVEVLFGCWSAPGRKRVERVCEEHDRLLFFSASYEGMEDSPAVVYLGGTPNQTLTPLVRWAYSDLGRRRFFLLGAEDVYSRAVHVVMRHEIEKLGAKVVGEKFQLVGDAEFGPVVADVVASKADFLINTIDGPVNQTVLQALRGKGVRPPAVPTAWTALSESELGMFTLDDVLGDYTVANYFESIDRPENLAFVQRVQKRFAGERVNDAMQTAYFGVHLWKKAVEKAKSTRTEKVREALKGMEIDAPEGPIKLADARHAYRTGRVGKIIREGSLPQFEIVHTTAGPIAPEPYPPWKERREWETFINDLYRKWGDRWDKHR